MKFRQFRAALLAAQARRDAALVAWHNGPSWVPPSYPDDGANNEWNRLAGLVQAADQKIENLIVEFVASLRPTQTGVNFRNAQPWAAFQFNGLTVFCWPSHHHGEGRTVREQCAGLGLPASTFEMLADRLAEVARGRKARGCDAPY